MTRHVVLLLLALLLNRSTAITKCSRSEARRLVVINPPTLFDPLPFGYSHIAVDTANKIAYIAGQVAINQTGSIVGSSLAEQLVETERNLNFALAAVDADIPDIMKLNAYIFEFSPDPDLPTFQATGKRLGSPPSTLVSVPSLAIDGLLVEIELTVAVSRKFVRSIRCSK